MTYTLHVLNVFDKMIVMVRPGKVKSLIRFCVRSFVFVSFNVLESFIKFWAVVWRLGLKKKLRFHGRMHITRKMRLQSLPCKLMHATGGHQWNLSSVMSMARSPD